MYYLIILHIFQFLEDSKSVSKPVICGHLIHHVIGFETVMYLNLFMYIWCQVLSSMIALVWKKHLAGNWLFATTEAWIVKAFCFNILCPA